MLEPRKSFVWEIHFLLTSLPTGSTNMTDSKKIPFGSVPYFLVCGLGGSISAGGTHLAITPLDLIKCRMQTNAAKYNGITNSLRITVAEDGVRGLARGWAPTALGYGLQGFSKFAFYEVFKIKYAAMLGEDNAHKYRSLVFLAAASTAEGIGDVALAPFEAAKVRTQTDPTAPRTLRQCLPLIYKENGLNGLFKGLAPLWMRQIPYTASKFVCFEYTIENLYKHFIPKDRSQCSKKEQMGVTFVAGCIAGVVCALVSHPPDVIVSLMYKNSNMSFKQAVSHVGVRGMWSGLRARMLMIASIAAAQLFIVDSTKMAFNLESPPLRKQ